MRSGESKSGALRAPRRWRRSQRGQAAVEFVIVLPILLVLLFALIEFASAWRKYQLITNISREGVRLAVVNRTNPDPLVTTRVNNLLDDTGLSSADATVTLSCNGTDGSLCTNTGDQDGVQIDYPHQWVFMGPVLNLMCPGCGSSFGSVTLTAKSIMRKE